MSKKKEGTKEFELLQLLLIGLMAVTSAFVEGAFRLFSIFLLGMIFFVLVQIWGDES